LSLVAVAGSNGAGKSTFYHAHLCSCGLHFVNADELPAANRHQLLAQRESFVFETVLSDPHGAKVAELVRVAGLGVHVVLVFIRIDSPETSKQRVSMRVMQGGHDVPDDKLESRFPRTLANLGRAIQSLPVVVVFDHSDLSRPYRLEAVYRQGERVGP
jgi:predicted ABC-type ATPase